MKNKQYFQLMTAGSTANLTIYGDITSYPWTESDVSAYNLSAQLAEMQGVTEIHVYINSYGGEVREGLAIYNALKRHPAKVVTHCDGMACSIASVIFMAGDERVMCNPSFLMIHDAWMSASGNANDFRKAADDLDVITTASVTAYMEHCNLSEEELRAKMQAETWLTHTEAVEMGFATGIEEASAIEQPAQSAKKRAFELLMQAIQFNLSDDEDEEDEKEEETPQNAPETDESDPDEEPDEEEEEDGENGNSEPEKAPDKDEEDEDKEVPDPAQKWSGFFNAIFRE